MPPALDFQNIFKHLPDLYLVLDSNLTILTASEAYLAASFTKRETITGKNLFEVFPDNPDEPGATGVSNLRHSLESVLNKRKPHTMAVQKYDVRRPDGSFIERYWSPVNTPVLNKDGEVEYIIHKVEDVTDYVHLSIDRENNKTLTEDLRKQLSEMEADIYQRAQEIQELNKDLEEQINEKTAELRDIFERISDGFVAISREGTFIYANKQAERELGIDARKHYGKNINDVFPEEIRVDFFSETFKRALETGINSNAEVYSTLYNTWFEIHMYPSPSGMSIFFRDISERKKAEEQLRASEQKYKLLFESNPLPMWMLSLPERDFIAVNDSAVSHYGYSKEEFLKMNAKQIRPPDDVERFQALLNTPYPGIYHAGNWRHVKKDGTIIYAEIISHDIVYEGKIARLILANDITEKLKAQEALKQSEEINRLIMSSSLNAIICMDKDDKIIFWNPQAERIFGWEKEAMIGRTLSETIIPPKYRERYRMGFNRFLSTGESPLLKKLIEITALNRNGTEFYIELAIIPVKENGNEFYCCFIQDITNRKKAEEQLNQSHAQLRQLASHLQDIREEEQKRIAREVHDELGQQITGLKMDIAWIWKKIAGRKEVLPIEEKLQEMTELLDSAVQTIRKIASELRPSILDDLGVIAAMEWQSSEFQKRFLIPVDFKTSLTQLQLDSNVATGLFRLYQESLTNIARHANARNVATQLETEDSKITLSIRDDGKGFDINKTDGKKTLGLLGMRERVLMMNGELKILSKPGKGTTVLITVPFDNGIM